MRSQHLLNLNAQTAINGLDQALSSGAMHGCSAYCNTRQLRRCNCSVSEAVANADRVHFTSLYTPDLKLHHVTAPVPNSPNTYFLSSRRLDLCFAQRC